MGNTLKRIDYWTSEIVRWVHFIFIPSTVVNGVVASKDNRITESLVLIVNRDLRSDTILSSLILVNSNTDNLFGSKSHFVENPEVILDGTIAALTFDAVHTFLSHLM